MSRQHRLKSMMTAIITHNREWRTEQESKSNFAAKAESQKNSEARAERRAAWFLGLPGGSPPTPHFPRISAVLNWKTAWQLALGQYVLRIYS